MYSLGIIYFFKLKQVIFRFFKNPKLLIIFLLIGCQINPASGEKELNLLSEKEEQAIGAKEHPKILKEFGGKYDNKRIENYVKSLGNFLVSTSEMSNKNFRFTVLDSPIINAFALPGGYIYLTRGLIALCQNEAQLAGVIAHEIGHITARHSARRYTRNISTSLLVNILGSLTKSPVIQNLVGQSASLYLLSYSRNQEYEADKLSTRYMIRAGFDPREMANFLSLMKQHSDLQKKIIKNKNQTSELLLTHPNSSKRVLEVINNSNEKIPINPIIGESIFLKKIDGMIFGDSPDGGFFYKNSFVHKSLKISFKFDKDFYFLNNPKFLLGLTNDDTNIIFDIDNKIADNNINYLAEWAKVSKKNIFNFQEFYIGNFISTIGTLKRKGKLIRLVAIKDNEVFYRFTLISNKNELEKYNQKFLDLIYSFRKHKGTYLEKINPPKIGITTFSGGGESLSKITKNLNLQKKYSTEFFRIINNLKDKDPEIGQKIKTLY